MLGSPEHCAVVVREPTDQPRGTPHVLVPVPSSLGSTTNLFVDLATATARSRPENASGPAACRSQPQASCRWPHDGRDVFGIFRATSYSKDRYYHGKEASEETPTAGGEKAAPPSTSNTVVVQFAGERSFTYICRQISPDLGRRPLLRGLRVSFRGNIALSDLHGPVAAADDGVMRTFGQMRPGRLLSNNLPY